MNLCLYCTLPHTDLFGEKAAHRGDATRNCIGLRHALKLGQLRRVRLWYAHLSELLHTLSHVGERRGRVGKEPGGKLLWASACPRRGEQYTVSWRGFGTDGVSVCEKESRSLPLPFLGCLPPALTLGADRSCSSQA